MTYEEKKVYETLSGIYPAEKRFEKTWTIRWDNDKQAIISAGHKSEEAALEYIFDQITRDLLNAVDRFTVNCVYSLRTDGGSTKE